MNIFLYTTLSLDVLSAVLLIVLNFICKGILKTNNYNLSTRFEDQRNKDVLSGLIPTILFHSIFGIVMWSGNLYIYNFLDHSFSEVRFTTLAAATNCFSNMKMRIVNVDESVAKARRLHQLMKENANGNSAILTDIVEDIRPSKQLLKKEIDTGEISDGSSVSGYTIGRLIGCGGYGKVFLARKDSKNYAIKIRKNETNKQMEENRHECLILSCISTRHATQHLVECFETFHHGTNFCYVMEKLDVSLQEYLKMRGPGSLELKQVLQISYELLTATAALSDIGYLHCDIKPGNILFCNIWNPSDPWKIKLCDFGLSRSLCKIGDPSGYVHTINFRAPEAILGFPLCERADSWSTGCVLFRIYAGFGLFPVKDELELLRQMEIITGFPDGYENGQRVNKLFSQKETGELVIRTDPRTQKYAMQYIKRGFQGLEKFGNNYKTTGSFTEMDSVIVRLISSLLQPNANRRLNAAEARDYIKLHICAYEESVEEIDDYDL